MPGANRVNYIPTSTGHTRERCDWGVDREVESEAGTKVAYDIMINWARPLKGEHCCRIIARTRIVLQEDHIDPGGWVGPGLLNRPIACIGASPSGTLCNVV